MIPTIGVLVAIYAVARLLLAPMQMYQPGSARWIFAIFISAAAIVGIGLCAVDLVLSGTRVGNLPAVQ